MVLSFQCVGLLWLIPRDGCGRRKDHESRRTKGMGILSCSVECQALAASCGFVLQELLCHRIWRGAPVLRGGCVQSGIAALRCGSQMYKSCAIGSDRPVMSTLKY